MSWAILSGIEGNLAAYEAVVGDIHRQRLPVEELYVLGDLIAPVPESIDVIDRIRSPRSHELAPQVCRGWWEEQFLTLHGLGRTEEPIQLIEKYGLEMVAKLWEALPKEIIDWVQALDFGFFELDCLLIHGSTVSPGEELTPKTPPLQILDRLLRMDAKTMFCGRSGLTFQYGIEQGCIISSVTTLNHENPRESVVISPRQLIGVGNVGRVPGVATYTLYRPETHQVEFKTVRYGHRKGFQ